MVPQSPRFKPRLLLILLLVPCFLVSSGIGGGPGNVLCSATNPLTSCAATSGATCATSSGQSSATYSGTSCATSSRINNDTANESHFSDYWRENGRKFVRHVIRSLGWKSVIVIEEMTSEEEMGSLLAEDAIAVTVFHQSVSGTNNRSSVSDELYKALTSDLASHPAHFLLLGPSTFVTQILLEILRLQESASFTFDWLTAVPRDQASSILTVARRLDNMAVIILDTSWRLTLETILREGDSTRLTKVTEWSPCKSSSLPVLTEGMVFPNKMFGLGGRTLKVVTMVWSPFVIHHQNGSSTWYAGLCMDLLDILATNLNFTYVVSEPPDQNWGQQLPNGTWVGMTGMLHRKEVDLAMAGMSVTASRATVSDYTQGFYYDEIVMVTSFPDPTPARWTFFTRPFHWLVFVLLGCGLLVMTVFLALMDRWYSQAKSHHQSSDKDTRRGEIPHMSSSLVQAAEVLFGALLGRAMVYTGVSNSGRVLLCAWLLLSLVTVATYTGKLTSDSVLIKQPVPFKTLSELVKRTDYTWGFSRGSMLDGFFTASTNKDYQKFYRKMLEFHESDPDVRARFYDIVIPKLLTENYVRLTSESFYRFHKAKHCELTLVQERLAQDTLGVYLQKGSPYTKLFDEVIAQAVETGITEYLTTKWFHGHDSCYHGDETKVMSVSLEMVPVAFLMAAMGLLLASGMLLAEFLARNNKCQRQQDRSTPFCMPSCWM